MGNQTGHEFSTQEIQNHSWDNTYKNQTSLILGEDNPNSALRRIQVDANGHVKTRDQLLNSDAFARLRVSNPETLFDSKQIFDNQPLFWDDSEVSGSGTTSTHSVNAARTRIAVGATTAGKRVRQTFMRFNYQPGKSHLVIMTGVLGAGESGLTCRAGLFDDENGVFYSSEDGTMKVVQRSYVTGSAVDTKVSQSSWNLDPMDGTGPSGVTLDFSKTQIYFFDLEWLGVGRVRCGFFVDGEPVYVHQFLNTNNLDVVYMSTPNLPLRYSIENDGTASAASMDHICSTVISEGGMSELGVLRHSSTAGTQVDMTTEDTLYAIKGIRLKSTHLGSTIKLIKAAVTLQSASDDVEWVLVFDPTIAGSPTWNNETNSCVQTFTGATANTVTGGTHIDAGYISTGTGNSASGGMENRTENALLLGSAIDGTQQTIVLCARPINGSATNVLVEGGLTWRELS